MKNWKTTVFGILFSVALNGQLFGIPDKVAKPLAVAAGAVFAAASKDNNVTGGTVQQ